MIADLIIDNEMEDLDKYYGNKKLKKAEKLLGAYEATDHFENLGGRQPDICIFWQLLFMMKKGKLYAQLKHCRMFRAKEK